VKTSLPRSKMPPGPIRPKRFAGCNSIRRFGGLRAAGREIPDDGVIEIHPTFALDAEELATKLPKDWKYTGPTVLG